MQTAEHRSFHYAVGELTATNNPAYRRLRSKQVSRARIIQADLRRNGETWTIRTVRREVEEKTKSGSYGLFYNDVTLLTNDQGQARVVLATQVKSGDWSSSNVSQQINSDIRRELYGQIRVDDVDYTIVQVDPRPVRAFVGTALPSVGARASFESFDIGVDGDDLEALAELFLLSNGKIEP